MRRSLKPGAAAMAAAAAVAASLGTAVAMEVADDDPWDGHPGAMTSQRDWPRDGNGMPGGMHGPVPGGMPGGMDKMGGGMGGMHRTMQVTSEVDYLAEMVLHHEEAIEAARELQRSDRAEMRDFGEAIVSSQSAQVSQMQQWLDEWYPDRGEAPAYDPMMRDLEDLSGDQLDRVFLEDMVGHHMAAVMMSQRLLMQDLAEHDEVADLAEDIRDEQHAEIFQMQQWLREWW